MIDYSTRSTCDILSAFALNDRIRMSIGLTVWLATQLPTNFSHMCTNPRTTLMEEIRAVTNIDDEDVMNALRKNFPVVPDEFLQSNTEFHIAICLLKDLIHIPYEEYDKTNPQPTKDVLIRDIKPPYALFYLSKSI